MVRIKKMDGALCILTVILVVVMFKDPFKSKESLAEGTSIRNFDALLSALSFPPRAKKSCLDYLLNRTTDTGPSSYPEVPDPFVTRKNYLDSSVFHQLNTILREKAIGKYIVLILNTMTYDLVMINWLCAVHKNAPTLLDHVIVVNLDEGSHYFFSGKGINTVHVKLK